MNKTVMNVYEALNLVDVFEGSNEESYNIFINQVEIALSFVTDESGSIKSICSKKLNRKITNEVLCEKFNKWVDLKKYLEKYYCSKESWAEIFNAFYKASQRPSESPREFSERLKALLRKYIAKIALDNSEATVKILYNTHYREILKKFKKGVRSRLARDRLASKDYTELETAVELATKAEKDELEEENEDFQKNNVQVEKQKTDITNLDNLKEMINEIVVQNLQPNQNMRYNRNNFNKGFRTNRNYNNYRNYNNNNQNGQNNENNIMISQKDIIEKEIGKMLEEEIIKESVRKKSKLGTNKKLNSKWLGPYEIYLIDSDGNCTILAKNKKIKIHFYRLKYFNTCTFRLTARRITGSDNYVIKNYENSPGIHF